MFKLLLQLSDLIQLVKQRCGTHPPWTNSVVVSSTHQTHLSMQETSYGVLRPPLGSVRLTIIELVAVLLRTGSEEAEGAIIESSAVQEVLQVFLRFPFNSILHHQASPNQPPVKCAHTYCYGTTRVLDIQLNSRSQILPIHCCRSKHTLAVPMSEEDVIFTESPAHVASSNAQLPHIL